MATVGSRDHDDEDDDDGGDDDDDDGVYYYAYCSYMLLLLTYMLFMFLNNAITFFNCGDQKGLCLVASLNWHLISAGEKHTCKQERLDALRLVVRQPTEIYPLNPIQGVTLAVQGRGGHAGGNKIKSALSKCSGEYIRILLQLASVERMCVVFSNRNRDHRALSQLPFGEASAKVLSTARKDAVGLTDWRSPLDVSERRSGPPSPRVIIWWGFRAAGF